MPTIKRIKNLKDTDGVKYITLIIRFYEKDIKLRMIQKREIYT